MITARICSGLLLMMVVLAVESPAQQSVQDPLRLCAEIRAASDRQNLREVLQLFHSQPDLTQPGKLPVTEDAMGAASAAAQAAAILNDPAFPDIFNWAETLADKGIESENPRVFLASLGVHARVLEELQSSGRIEEAYGVAERAAKRRRSVKNGSAMGRDASRLLIELQEFQEMMPLLRGIGDLETLEHKFEQLIEMQDAGEVTTEDQARDAVLTWKARHLHEYL